MPEAAVLAPETSDKKGSGWKDEGSRRIGPTGYITESYVDFARPVAFAREAVRAFDDDTQALFFHILACTPGHVFEEGWVPVCSRLIDRHVRRASWEDLRDAGLIEATGYSVGQGLSRAYRTAPGFLERYNALQPAALEPASGTALAELFSGAATTKKLKTLLVDKANHSYGDKGSPLYDGLRVLKKIRTPFNRRAVEAHLALRLRRAEASFQCWQRSGGAKHTARFRSYMDRYKGPSDKRFSRELAYRGDRYTPLYKAYITEKARFENDNQCYKAVWRQRPRPAPELGEGIYEFSPAYSVQMSGRVGCMRGMFQSCSREMKLAAYSGIEGLRNYDLKSSQPQILLQLFEEGIAAGATGISTDWLAAYLADPKAKQTMADAAKVHVDTWKRLFCMTMMGAHVPHSWQWSDGDFIKALRDECDGEDVGVAFKRVRGVIGEFAGPRDAWLDYIVEGLVKTEGFNCGAGRALRNAAGMHFVPESIEKMHDRKAKTAAFLLQGFEAGFIHSLTVLGRKYGFEVVANEHDGLITIGEIPQPAIDEAAARVGLRCADLVPKPFCKAPLSEKIEDEDAAVATVPPPSRRAHSAPSVLPGRAPRPARGPSTTVTGTPSRSDLKPEVQRGGEIVYWGSAPAPPKPTMKTCSTPWLPGCGWPWQPLLRDLQARIDRKTPT